MKRVYCDTGGYRRELRGLQAQKLIELVTFQYENRNRNIKIIAPPSRPTWDEMNYKWKEMSGLIWDDAGKQSNKIGEISNLIGPGNSRDIKHLDSAYMAGCDAFLTSDKGDICAKSAEIHRLLKVKVFHFQDDWGSFVAFVEA